MKKSLPSRASLEQLKNQAKSLLKGHRTAIPEVLARVREHHPRGQEFSDAILAGGRFTLADAQLVIAKEYGFENWPTLKIYVLSQPVSSSIEATVEEVLNIQGDKHDMP